ncbi:copper amine oxidase N-terminal domain-containing protein [Paenibacillus dendritiformis]|uniref:Copper amine oxidase domain-containing protein n=1 Tax=Paenibacillus dendritiformis C454 TaxID=1131935 RepID=H3SPN6_9BACL|nr:copper amine oxidase N-terminal domain-containing protein [Paenibacillus dendritiformis]EHQ58986.1 copper amine oxidase domain-containing protein [Paenibacillus dendritiformis C454]CAH8769578.1 copper amine oxidase N-terminal domain-containing protein [Paenibacillus dendritiformis]
MRGRHWVCAGLAALLLVLAGCQPIGGLDVPKLLLKQMEVTSYEGKQTVSIDIEAAKNEVPAEDAAALQMIDGAELTVDTKVQDDQRMSMEGVFKAAGRQLPFRLGLKDRAVTAWIDGAAAPIIISEAADPSWGVSPLTTEDTRAIGRLALELFGKYAPNPSNISVKPVTEPVLGENLALKQVHLEFGGDELLPWAKELLRAAMKDKEGLKQWFVSAGRLLYPAATGALDDMPLDQDVLPDVLNDGEAAGLSLYESFMEYAPELLAGLEQLEKDLPAYAPDAEALLGPATKLVMDLYADGELNIRKSKLQLTIALPSSAGAPFSSITIRQTSEMGRLNEDVKADEMDMTNAVALDDPEMTPGKWLRHFEAGSLARQWLKQSGATARTASLLMPVPGADTTYDPYDMLQPYIKNGTLMVPLRHVAEQFDATLTWDSKTKLSLVDDITGAVTQLELNSKKATVGGLEIDLPEAPELRDGQLYVPVRSVAFMLGLWLQKVEFYDSTWIELIRK